MSTGSEQPCGRKSVQGAGQCSGERIMAAVSDFSADAIFNDCVGDTDEPNYHEEKKVDQPSSPSEHVARVASSAAVTRGVGSLQSQSIEGNHAQHVHFSAKRSPSHAKYTSPPNKPSFGRSSSLDYQARGGHNRTTSWTEHHKPPEPFSSPHPKKSTNQQNTSNIKKYGYGDLFRSSSSVVSRNNVRNNSVGGDIWGRRNQNRYERGNSEGRIQQQRSLFSKQKQSSFTKSDFPLLSPEKPKKQTLIIGETETTGKRKEEETSGQSERQTSWSAVVGGSERNLATSNELDESTSSALESCPIEATGILPPPLYDEIDIQEEVNSVEEAEEDEVPTSNNEPAPTSSPTQSSRTYWSSTQQRQRAHSFHQYSSDRVQQQHSSPHKTSSQRSLERKDSNIVYHPFSSFTTMSIAALQNDIGTLLARSNRVDEAMKRYKLCIESAKLNLEEMQANDNDSCNYCSTKEISTSNPRPGQKCPKVTEAEGLAWFRQKLLRGDMIPEPATSNSSDSEDGTYSTALGSSSPDSLQQPTSTSPTTQKSVRTTMEFPPPPFQPAGFGGCAPHSPRRMRSASFSVADLCPAPATPSRQQKQKHQIAMPFIEQAKSIDEYPKSPSRPALSVRNSSCPVTAPHPGKPTLSTFKPCSASQLQLPGRTHSTSFHHQHIAPLDDIVHDIHQHQKLDCPDEVYSCNGLTPLGLEYICDPLPVLGGLLRRLLSDTGASEQEKRDAAVIEMAALIAARLNLASLEYRVAGGGVGERLQHVLEILELALEDCSQADATAACSNATRKKSKSLFSCLRAVVHSNIGTVKYRLNKVRESLASFEAAMAALDSDVKDNDRHVIFDFDDSEDNSQDQSAEPHDDNRFPPHNYLLLVVRLNMSRVSLRLNKSDEATKFCKLISEDNKPHRRNASRRLGLPGSGYQRASFRRSNSFSATTSALETAVAAYEHDIDRRSKWLGSVAEHYISGLIHEANGEPADYTEAWHHYNRLLSTARVKLDHRHAYICALLERRGAVLFEQRKLQCSMLSYLACLKILEHQQSTGSNIFNKADLSRVLYAVARVLHDKEEYHDALYMYQRALACQRTLTAVSGRPSLDVITTLCNISRVNHLSGEIDAALAANREVLDRALILVSPEHPFLIHRLKVEGNILVEAGRLEDAMKSFIEAARRCSEDGRDRFFEAMMGGGGGGGSGVGSSQEDADAGDSSVLSIRSAAALAQLNLFYPAAAAG